MGSPYRAIIAREHVSTRVRINSSVLENRKYLPGFSAAICLIRLRALERPSIASTHEPCSSGAPEKISFLCSPHHLSVEKCMAFPISETVRKRTLGNPPIGHLAIEKTPTCPLTCYSGMWTVRIRSSEMGQENCAD